MTSKEKVLSVYPDALWHQPMHANAGAIFRNGSEKYGATHLSGWLATEAEAWDDAASKLPSAPSPAGETASEQRYVKVTDFPTRDGLFVNGDVALVIREYVEPASEWSGKPEIPMIVAVSPKWVQPLHLQPHQYEPVPEPVSTEGLPSAFGQMTGNLKVPPIVEALGPLTERDLLGFAAEVAAPVAPPPHITKEWDKDFNPICVPDCPACNAAPVAPAAVSEAESRMIEDLVMLVRRMVVRLQLIGDEKGNVLAGQAMDYLRRKDLASGASILRAAASSQTASAEGDGWIAVEKVAHYIESESKCLMPIVVGETKHAYGVRLLKVLANELREKFALPAPPSVQEEKGSSE